MSKITAWESSEQGSMGIRLMIIELRKYNEIGELLIELQGHRDTYTIRTEARGYL